MYIGGEGEEKKYPLWWIDGSGVVVYTVSNRQMTASGFLQKRKKVRVLQII